eukprot:TRINITY_DN268_c0_g1_i3.p1 TRINITY_DN268_c0_g1~~TRINITY_DN268_c0_g1_i3.p1  ORF type:complete len:717 (-),score=265.29 TRINITY_DN268_c0_g1_i3:461-2569(-)
MVHAGSVSQLKILLIKNFLLYLRSWQSTFLQVFAPFFFLVLLLVLQQIPTGGKPIPNPIEKPVYGIPTCVPFAKDYCYSLMYTPNNESRVQNLIEYVAKQSNLTISYWPNPEPGSIVAMPNKSVVQDYILESPNITQAVIEFFPNGTISKPYDFTYVMWYNETCRSDVNVALELYIGSICPDPRDEIQRSLDESIAMQIANKNISFTAATKEYPRVTQKTGFDDAVQTYGILFFFCGMMFNFVIILYQLVQEKELKLKQGMKVMGLKLGPFWLSWFITGMFVNIVSVLIMIGFGYVFKFAFFQLTDFGVLFVGFFLFGTAMLQVAFFVSCLLSSAKQAISIGMMLFIIGSVIQLFLSVPDFVAFLYGYKPAAKAIRGILFLYPPFNFAKFIGDVALRSYEITGVFGPGYSWQNIIITVPYGSYTYTACTLQSFYLLLLNALIYGFFTFILENLSPGESAAPRPWFFMFSNEFWSIQTPPPRSGIINDDIILPCFFDTDEDVLNEAKLVKSDLEGIEEITDENLYFVGISKIYSNFACCKSKNDVYAVKHLTLSAQSGKLLVLLGHNGAGKTTTISMLTGLFPPTSGDIFVCGYSVNYQMDDIRNFLGVCPQHDILWGDLTAREHLNLFAELKGITTRKERKQVVDQTLETVNLFRVADHRASTYSGGMKRRLSVAIAAIGNPKVLVLDEPTTGMDPVSKREK